MSALAMQAFGFEDQLVRVIERHDAPWFVAQDVCACLEIGNHRDAVSSLDEDERDGVGITDAIGREQVTTIISESGVYALIFRSRKAAAVRFRKWVTSEVLPTLRRTGHFALAAKDGAGAVVETAAEPDMIEDTPFIVRLSAVREARQLFGRKRAQALWHQLGLPDGRTGVASLAAPPDSVQQWLAQCTSRAAGQHVLSRDLYASYCEFCELTGVAHENPTVFGRALTALGHPPRPNSAGRIERGGLTLAA